MTLECELLLTWSHSIQSQHLGLAQGDVSCPISSPPLLHLFMSCPWARAGLSNALECFMNSISLLMPLGVPVSHPHLVCLPCLRVCLWCWWSLHSSVMCCWV